MSQDNALTCERTAINSGIGTLLAQHPRAVGPPAYGCFRTVDTFPLPLVASHCQKINDV